ncbi:MAG: FecR domain-containing protein [Clostridium sp.]|nr:FecR domain-containing protein [Clostridium sp.]
MLGGKKRIRAAVLLICGVLMLNPAAGCAGPKNGNQATVSSEAVEQAVARCAVIVQMTTASGKEAGVEVERNHGRIRGYAGMRLEIGDVVKTDRDTVVYLRIDEDKNLRLSADSSVAVTEAGRDRIRIQVESGELFVNVENKLEDHETMEFSAGSTTMSIRGTSLDIGYTDEDGLLLMVTDGHVSVTEDGSGRETMVNGGQMTEVEADDRTGEIRVENYEISDLPKNVLAELKNDEALRERVLSSIAETSGKSAEDLRKILDQNLSAVKGYDFGIRFAAYAKDVWEKYRSEDDRYAGNAADRGPTGKTVSDTEGRAEEAHRTANPLSAPDSGKTEKMEENGQAEMPDRNDEAGSSIRHENAVSTGNSGRNGRNGGGSANAGEMHSGSGTKKTGTGNDPEDRPGINPAAGDKTKGSGTKPSTDSESRNGDQNSPSTGNPSNDGSGTNDGSNPGGGNGTNDGSAPGGGSGTNDGGAPGGGSDTNDGSTPGGGSGINDGSAPGGGGTLGNGNTSNSSGGVPADSGYSIDRNRIVTVYGENVNVRNLIEFMREKQAISMICTGGRLKGWPEDSDFYKAVNDGHSYSHVVSYKNHTYDIEYSDEGMQIWFPDVDGVYDEIGDFEDCTTANNNAMYNGLLTSHIAAPAGYAARSAMNLLTGMEKGSSPAEAGEPDAGRTATKDTPDGVEPELSNDGGAVAPDLQQDETVADSENETADGGKAVTDSGNETADSGKAVTDSGNETADSGKAVTDSGNETADGGKAVTDSGNETADGGKAVTDSGNETADGGKATKDSGNETADGWIAAANGEKTERSDEDGPVEAGSASEGNVGYENDDSYGAGNASPDTGEDMRR